MTNDTGSERSPWTERHLSESPSRDLWPDIEKVIRYENKLEKLERRKQQLEKRIRYLSFATAATVILCAALLTLKQAPDQDKFSPAVLEFSKMSEKNKLSPEFEAFFAQSSLVKHPGFEGLDLFSEKTKIYIQYEDENMDKKIIAAGVFGLLTGTSTAAFILDSNPHSNTNSNLEKFVEPNRPHSAQGFDDNSDQAHKKCNSESNVSTGVCQSHLSDSLSGYRGEQVQVAASRGLSSNDFTGSSDSLVSETRGEHENVSATREQRFDKLKQQWKQAPTDYYDYIPPGYEEMTRPRHQSYTRVPSERVLTAMEKSIDTQLYMYARLDDFYSQIHSARNTELELQVFEYSIVSTGPDFALDQVDCIGDQCYLYGWTEGKWQLEKFVSDVSQSVSKPFQTQSLTRGRKQEVTGQQRFVLQLGIRKQERR